MKRALPNLAAVLAVVVFCVALVIVIALRCVRRRIAAGRRYSVSELCDLSRTDIPEWPYVRCVHTRQVPESAEVQWERVTRALGGDQPPQWDPRNPQRGEESR